jgi:Pyridoxamine 5'-phosphate oxidase
VDEQTTINGNGARPIRGNLGAHFACVSLNQWMALTPPDLVQAHLNLDQQTLAALRRDKPFLVASQQQCRKRKPLPEWPDRTIAVLSTQNEEVHAIPITAPLRIGDRQILLRLKRCRESLARLREHPKVALTIFAKGNLAFTARGPARVVQEPMLGAPMFAAVAIDVENIDDHRQRDLVVDSGVSLDWTNERTQRFVQENLNALREVAVSGE